MCYFFNIISGVVHSSFSNPDRVQNCSCYFGESLIFNDSTYLPQTQQRKLLSMSIYKAKCTDNLHGLVPSVYSYDFQGVE